MQRGATLIQTTIMPGRIRRREAGAIATNIALALARLGQRPALFSTLAAMRGEFGAVRPPWRRCALGAARDDTLCSHRTSISLSLHFFRGWLPPSG